MNSLVKPLDVKYELQKMKQKWNDKYNDTNLSLSCASKSAIVTENTGVARYANFYIKKQQIKNEE